MQHAHHGDKGLPVSQLRWQSQAGGQLCHAGSNLHLLQLSIIERPSCTVNRVYYKNYVFWDSPEILIAHFRQMPRWSTHALS